MKSLRNALIVYGAVVASAHLARMVVNVLFRPLPWSGAGSDRTAIAWWLGSVCVSAALAGLVASVSIERPVGRAWAVALGVFAALENGPDDWRRAFSGVPAFARVVFVSCVLAGMVAVGCFYLVGSKSAKKRAA